MSGALRFDNAVFTVASRRVLVKGQIAAGERVALMGPSGCGKSSLLRVVAGLHPLESGRIFLGQRELSSLPVQERGLAVMFQSAALFPQLNVLQNVAFALRHAAASRAWSNELCLQRAREALAAMGLADLTERLPTKLSGGEERRVALARALAPRASALLLDEPLAAVDAEQRVHIEKWILSQVQHCPVPLLLLTHDENEARRLGSRMLRWPGDEPCVLEF